jgi:hypothetical protein
MDSFVILGRSLVVETTPRKGAGDAGLLVIRWFEARSGLNPRTCRSKGGCAIGYMLMAAAADQSGRDARAEPQQHASVSKAVG